MAHKTLIGGTSYEIGGGKTLVGGTGYEIEGGRTLVGGTEYDIEFSKEIFTVTYTTNTSDHYGYLEILIGDKSIKISKDCVVEVEAGTPIRIYLSMATHPMYANVLYLNGSVYAYATSYDMQLLYDSEVNQNLSIERVVKNYSSYTTAYEYIYITEL